MNIENLDYDAYAELLIKTGVSLREGSNLIIRFHPEGALLARKCAEKAYAAGAGVVELMIDDPPITKARIDAQAGKEEELAKFAGWTSAWENTIVDEKWAFLALVSYETPGVLADCDQKSVMLYEKNRALSRMRFKEAVTSHSIPWCVASVPGPRWAEDVLGKGKTTKDLWTVLQPILLLDQENPAEEWKKKAELLAARSRILDDMQIKTLRFKGEGTNLEIGLLPESIWRGGGGESNGIKTMPNIPTEEVFTTPDFRRCSGTVRITRPVEIRGTIVKGAQLSFENGVVVDFDALEGKEALAGYLGTDAGAKRLGEVALVGEDSPIAASSLVFGSILYDENASCHIALGSGYPGCLSNGGELDTDDKKEAAGCNVSLVHVDFMIGSSSMDVTGVDKNDRETPIMEKGRFLI